MEIVFLAILVAIVLSALVQDKFSYKRGKRDAYNEIMNALGVKDGYHIVSVSTEKDIK